MNSIIETLKSKYINSRIVCNYRWLVWDRDYWKVYEQKPNRCATIIVTTKLESIAIQCLITDC